MKLLTKKLIKRFKEIGRQEDTHDPIIICKFFFPASSWTWYATEYHEDTKEFFGLVEGDYTELGYFSLTELESTLTSWSPIERDRYRKEKTLSEIK